MDVRKYYLETSVIYNKILGSKRQQGVVDAKISGGICYASFYIKKEFRERIILPIIDLIDFIEITENITEAIKEFKYANGFSSRTLITLIDEICAEIIIPTNRPKEEVKAELISKILVLEKKFHEIVDKSRMIDHIKCPANRGHLNTPNDIYNLKVTCSPSCCKIDFFKKRKEKLKLIIDKYRTDELNGVFPKGKHKKLIGKLVAIYEDIYNDISITETSMLKLSDTIIALEAPVTAELVSFDEIFNYLCPILSTRFSVLKQPPQIKPKKKL